MTRCYLRPHRFAPPLRPVSSTSSLVAPLCSPIAPSCFLSAPPCSLYARSLPLYAPPQPLPSLVLAVNFLQVQARPFVQLEMDANPMAPYMALPAVHVRPSPFSPSFVSSTLHGVFVLQLTGSCHSVRLDSFCDVARFLYQSHFQ